MVAGQVYPSVSSRSSLACLVTTLLKGKKMISLLKKDARDRKPGDSELRVDSRNGEDLPPVNFERETGWPANQYEEYLAWKEKQDAE